MISKKAEKFVKEYVRRTPKEDLCIARVTNSLHVKPGPYSLLPILCTFDETATGAIVFLTSFLLRPRDDHHVGVVDWLLPFNERTEGTIAKLLVALGWDGRVWPDDEGWPGQGQEAQGLRTLLASPGLRATLTFPPAANGSNATLRQEILKQSSEFYMPPDVGNDDVVVTPEHLEKLRSLAADPSIFKKTHTQLKPSRLGAAVGLKTRV